MAQHDFTAGMTQRDPQQARPVPTSQMSDTEYEQLVQNVHRSIMRNEGATIEVLHDVKIQGKSGHKHQIDVYWKFKIGNIEYQTAIECKKYKSNINVGRVKDFKATLDDIGNINGIMVTTNGYQKGAALFASQYNIQLVVLRSVKDQDLDNTIQLIIMNINAISRSLVDFTVNTELGSIPEEERQAPERVSIAVDTASGDGILDQSGQVARTWKDVLDEMERHNASGSADFDTVQTFMPSVADGYLRHPRYGLIKINSIVIKYKINLMKAEVHVKNPHPAHYIMTTVNKDGEIFHIHDNGTSLKVK